MFVINATDYAPIDPLTPPCDVNQINIGYVGENHARCLVFDLTECVAQFGEGGFAISFIRHGDYLPYLVTDTDRLENNAIWIINSTDTAVEGYGMVQLQYIVGTTVVKSALYQTVTFASNEIPGNVPDPYEDLLTQIAAYAAQAEGAATTATAAAQTASAAVEDGIKTERSQRIAADNGLQLQITELMGLAGAPSMAATAAAMTDSNKVYVYTGNEAGYINGNWYYYNGTEWVSGGVYQATAVNTDKTLTVENMAADAKVTGERIDECMAAFVTEQTSGSICAFDDGADNVPVKGLTVNITALQSGSGDPSPTNIRPITGFDAANVFVDGKNILRYRDTMPPSSTFSGITYTPNADGSITMNGTSNGTNGFSLTRREDPTPLKPGMTYHFKLYGGYNGTDGVGTLQLYVDSTSVFTSSDITYTMPDSFDTCYLRIRIANGTVIDNVTVYPMVTLESQWDGGEYEQYKGTKYPISFGSADTVYGGTLDVTTGMLTVTNKRINDLSALTWQYYTAGTNPLFRASISGRKFGTDADGITGMCSMYKFYRNTTLSTLTSTLPDKNLGFQTTAAWFAIRDDSYTDVDSFKAAIAGQSLVYPLETPISYQLTPTEVKTLLGINNIWADTGDITNLEYRADTKLYIEHLTTPDGDMVADSNIASGSYFMVNNRLYIATAAIASGASIVPGTNCTETNLAAALNAINA